jgi:hypothetical protein
MGPLWKRPLVRLVSNKLPHANMGREVGIVTEALSVSDKLPNKTMHYGETPGGEGEGPRASAGGTTGSANPCVAIPGSTFLLANGSGPCSGHRENGYQALHPRWQISSRQCGVSNHDPGRRLASLDASTAVQEPVKILACATHSGGRLPRCHAATRTKLVPTEFLQRPLRSPTWPKALN